MKLSKCESGHFYDSDKYPECPYCNTELLKDHSIVHQTDGYVTAAKLKDAYLGIGVSIRYRSIPQKAS